MVCIIRRGALWAPAGGHMGPPLRILTNGADRRKHLIRHGLSAMPPSPWGEGRARRVVAPHAGDPSPKNSQFLIINS